MNITKAQKEAIISLLKDKIADKQKDITAKYLADNKEWADQTANTILEKIKRLQEICNEYNSIYNFLKDFREKNLKGNITLPYISGYYSEHRVLCTYTIDDIYDILKTPQIKEPDYNKVRRDLELAALDPIFNINEFINKYL